MADFADLPMFCLFYGGIMKKEVIETLNKIKENRTHCQCSRTKVVERIAFDEIISNLEAVSEWNKDEVVRMLTANAEKERHPSDSQIFKIAYNYAVKIVETYDRK